jgi:PPOX class probable F420-dependent enzyme
MSRRAEIAMSPEELRAFLDQELTLTCATTGPNGRPHLMPLWYVRQGDVIACWTYGVSQKVKNLERLPQATLQVEAGKKYEELRGAMLDCDVEIVRDREGILDIGVALAYRYGHAPAGAPPELVRAGAEKRGAKRVGLRFRPTRIVSWDHRKLGGAH